MKSPWNRIAKVYRTIRFAVIQSSWNNSSTSTTKMHGHAAAKFPQIPKLNKSLENKLPWEAFILRPPRGRFGRVRRANIFLSNFKMGHEELRAAGLSFRSSLRLKNNSESDSARVSFGFSVRRIRFRWEQRRQIARVRCDTFDLLHR